MSEAADTATPASENGSPSRKPAQSEEPSENGKGNENETEDTKTEKKTPRKRGPPKETVDTPQSEPRKSERVPKKPNVFQPEEKKEAEFKLPEGSGTPIGDIPNCAKAFRLYSPSEKFWAKLHRLMYGVGSKKLKVKANISQFKGFPKGDDSKAKLEKKIHSTKLEMKKDLKPICHVLDLDRDGTREELRERIVDFLLHPKASGRDYRGREPDDARSKGGQKRKAKSKREGGSRPVSGYMFFVKMNRERVKEKHPDASFGELGKLLGKKWNKLTDKEKEEWNEKARKDSKNSSPKKSPKTKKSKKESDSSGSDREGSDDSSESEEEEEGEEEEELSEKMKVRIQEILKGDVESLSVKKIKDMLRGDFADEVENKGDEIKAFVRECLK